MRYLSKEWKGAILLIASVYLLLLLTGCATQKEDCLMYDYYPDVAYKCKFINGAQFCMNEHVMRRKCAVRDV